MERVGSSIRACRTPGKGSTAGRSPDSMRRIVIAFDIETFEEVRARATDAGTSFAEQVRLLTTFGLEAANEA